MLIACMINLLLLHCNSIHAASLVIIPAQMHHKRKVPLTISKQSSSGRLVVVFNLCDYRALKIDFIMLTRLGRFAKIGLQYII